MTQSLDKKTHRLIMDAVLVVAALGFSYLERLVPLQLLIPIPGVRLGLSVVVILYAVCRLSLVDAVAIIIVRSSIQFLLFSNPVSFFFSLTGGILASIIMRIMAFSEDRFFSIYGISMMGAAVHHVGQLIAASILMGNSTPMRYLMPLLLSSIIVGAFSATLLKLIEKVLHIKRPAE